MKNRLKGTTLMETVLYIGILSLILFILVNFLLSTTEATVRTERKADVYDSSEFITQHLDYIFSDITSINPTKSTFNSDNGTLFLYMNSGEHNYTLIDKKLLYDGTNISSKKVEINKFNIVPLKNRKDETVGVKIALEISSSKDPKIRKEIKTLYTIR